MLAHLWKRGVDFLGSRFAIMGGAMQIQDFKMWLGWGMIT
ncbi:hypothetical protein ANAPC1_00434 [Anaplasma phagocytophilum]|uniref:Uncharacterized protein n=2 Tax=Anaplasma phagocytophilum TaxID=948 RepID=A0A098EEX1_ANAPH|nr:hypothetical protein APHMUC_0804 [Anaplasma phagocytophilum str. ApMUC09]CEG20838.1 Protein of unknown function [Anaplasma phagocytophilum]SBO14090.1 hypothetical protein ANAPC1_00434 [Anaplasma phagocytophilum]SBO29978.1 hypothetical protein ANAPC3_00056 [Anaplasma phagocytophilum]SBO30730.1 hypothetical protein ANAPC4_00279 [Anaplasma phagocytophilum]